MKLRTELQPPTRENLIDFSTKTVMLGSCFADEIGERLKRSMLDVEVNPAGALYNPLSIAATIDDALSGRIFSTADIFEHEGRFHSFFRHSSFSRHTAAETLKALQHSSDRIGRSLREANLLIITFGSTALHINNRTGKVVANCHKLPSKLFRVEQAGLEAIIKEGNRLIDSLRSVNPLLRVILTVSPIRHIGYGLTEDRLGKSKLIVACHQLAEKQGVSYFPSYEALVDDLRDYRFYADDLVHPSPVAVEYIHDIFSRSFMSEKTRAQAAAWFKLTKSCLHRFDTDGPQKLQFEQSVMEKALALSSLHENTSEIYNRFKEYYRQCQSTRT